MEKCMAETISTVDEGDDSEGLVPVGSEAYGQERQGAAVFKAPDWQIVCVFFPDILLLMGHLWMNTSDRCSTKPNAA